MADFVDTQERIKELEIEVVMYYEQITDAENTLAAEQDKFDAMKNGLTGALQKYEEQIKKLDAELAAAEQQLQEAEQAVAASEDKKSEKSRRMLEEKKKHEEKVRVAKTK